MPAPQKKYFGKFGGTFAPETLMPALREVEEAYAAFRKNKTWQRRYRKLLTDYCGRETPLYFAESLTRALGGAPDLPQTRGPEPYRRA